MKVFFLLALFFLSCKTHHPKKTESSLSESTEPLYLTENAKNIIIVGLKDEHALGVKGDDFEALLQRFMDQDPQRVSPRVPSSTTSTPRPFDSGPSPSRWSDYRSPSPAVSRAPESPRPAPPTPLKKPKDLPYNFSNAGMALSPEEIITKIKEKKFDPFSTTENTEILLIPSSDQAALDASLLFFRENLDPSLELSIGEKKLSREGHPRTELIIKKPELKKPVEWTAEGHPTQSLRKLDDLVLQLPKDSKPAVLKGDSVGLKTVKDRISREFGMRYTVTDVEGGVIQITYNPDAIFSSAQSALARERTVTSRTSSEVLAQIQSGGIISEARGGVLVLALKKDGRGLLDQVDSSSLSHYSESIRIPYDELRDPTLIQSLFGFGIRRDDVEIFWLHKGKSDFSAPELRGAPKIPVKQTYNETLGEIGPVYTADGCDLRADLLSARLTRTGTDSKNRYIVTGQNASLKLEETTWRFHVTSVVSIQDELAGSTAALTALDPILGPKPVAEWESKILEDRSTPRERHEAVPNALGWIIVPKGKYASFDVPADVTFDRVVTIGDDSIYFFKKRNPSTADLETALLSKIKTPPSRDTRTTPGVRMELIDNPIPPPFPSIKW